MTATTTATPAPVITITNDLYSRLPLDTRARLRSSNVLPETVRQRHERLADDLSEATGGFVDVFSLDVGPREVARSEFASIVDAPDGFRAFRRATVDELHTVEVDWSGIVDVPDVLPATVDIRDDVRAVVASSLRKLAERLCEAADAVGSFVRS